ncbi:MAG: hypothetical protein MUF21_02205 [Gemmatimonadaceae bacterium]|jgi:hypothetical protein|nr:hypothetical protein [Gemmatimonadaceae bacterium]
MRTTGAAIRRLLAGAALVAAAPALVAQQRDTARTPRDTTPVRGPVREPAGAVRRDTGAARDGRRAQAVTAPRDPRLDPPIAPSRAFFRSFAVPGWGQARLGRRRSALVWGLVEAGTIAWGLKARRDLNTVLRQRNDSILVDTTTTPDRYERVIPPGLINARRLHFEDAVAVLVANHLLSGADAFVAAHLWDLPVRVSIRALPERRGATLAASMAW